MIFKKNHVSLYTDTDQKNTQVRNNKMKEEKINVKLNHMKFASLISLGRNKQFSDLHDHHNYSSLVISY